jgi:hypothetical protein
MNFRVALAVAFPCAAPSRAARPTSGSSKLNVPRGGTAAEAMGADALSRPAATSLSASRRIVPFLLRARRAAVAAVHADRTPVRGRMHRRYVNWL